MYPIVRPLLVALLTLATTLGASSAHAQKKPPQRITASTVPPAIPGAPARIAVRPNGTVSTQRLTGPFQHAVRPNRLAPVFHQSTPRPAPSHLALPSGTRVPVAPGSTLAPTTSRNGNPNGGMAVIPPAGSGKLPVRVHPPVAGRGGAPSYATGYVTAGTRKTGTHDPLTGRPVPRNDPRGHIPLGTPPRR